MVNEELREREVLKGCSKHLADGYAKSDRDEVVNGPHKSKTWDKTKKWKLQAIISKMAKRGQVGHCLPKGLMLTLFDLV